MSLVAVGAAVLVAGALGWQAGRAADAEPAPTTVDVAAAPAAVPPSPTPVVEASAPTIEPSPPSIRPTVSESPVRERAREKKRRRRADSAPETPAPAATPRALDSLLPPSAKSDR